MMTPRILDITAETYHFDVLDVAAPALSSSIIKLLCNDSPLHAWTCHPKLNPNWIPEDATKATDIGTVVHALLLEGVTVAEILDFPDWRTKDARTARDLARESNKIPILAKDWPNIEAMVQAAHRQLEQHAEAKNAFTNGKPEQTIVWQEENGVFCKIRTDWLHMPSLRFIDDYKSTGVSANPELVSRTMFNNGWDIQAALYIRGVKALDPKADPVFRFIVQETYAPYALSVIAPGPDVLTLAEKKILWAIDKWAECNASGVWPGYPSRICWASLPEYEETKWLRKEENSVVHI